jgi:chromosome segregation ATPase
MAAYEKLLHDFLETHAQEDRSDFENKVSLFKFCEAELQKELNQVRAGYEEVQRQHSLLIIERDALLSHMNSIAADHVRLGTVKDQLIAELARARAQIADLVEKRDVIQTQLSAAYSARDNLETVIRDIARHYLRLKSSRIWPLLRIMSPAQRRIDAMGRKALKRNQ